MKLFILVFLSLVSLNAWSYDPDYSVSLEDNKKAPILEGIGIQERLGADLPLNLAFQDEEGQTVKLADYFGRGRPVILSLVYYSCPSLCNLHINGVLDGLSKLNLKAGKDYELLAISFDPKEESTVAAAKRENYLNEYDLTEQAQGIHFLTGSPASIKTLADSVGFTYKWNEKINEWAHASAAILSTDKGKVSRYLHGVYFEPKTLRLSLVETSAGKVGSIVDSIVLFCYNYDPQGSKYAFAAFRIMQVGAGFVLLMLALWLLPVWRRAIRGAGA